MKSEQSFGVNAFYIFLKLLPLYSTMIPGIFADNQYEYAASVSLQNLQSSNNAYFVVSKNEGENSVAKIKTLPFRLNDCTIYLYDYLNGKDSYSNNSHASTLCTSLFYTQDTVYKDELRYKVLRKFLFPHQNSCPMKRDQAVIPTQVKMAFNYLNANLPCDTWTYQQEILKEDNLLINLELKMNMLPKYKCAPVPNESTDAQNKRYNQFFVDDSEYRGEVETQIEAPLIDIRMGSFEPSKALSDIAFEPVSNFYALNNNSKLIIVQPGQNSCLNEKTNNGKSGTIKATFENPENCKWLTLRITRNCIAVLVYTIVEAVFAIL